MTTVIPVADIHKGDCVEIGRRHLEVWGWEDIAGRRRLLVHDPTGRTRALVVPRESFVKIREAN